MLLKADKMTMANSIELRVPFLDKEVWNVARKIPTKYLIRNKKTKEIFRSVADEVMPEDWSKRRKLGFPVPVRDWMRDDDVYNDIKNEFEKPIANKYFNTKRLIKLLDDHKNRKHDNYRKVWNIYIFLKWYDRFFVKES
jgi:asparagine synthase (glutamine-hydrolysing)